MNQKPKKIFLKDYRPPNFWIDEVALCFDLHETETIVQNTSTFRQNPENPSQKLQLNAENMHVLEVKLDGKVLEKTEWKHTKNFLEIASVPANFTLETKVKIDPKNNLELAGLYLSDGIFCTQCEPLGFRRITPHLDRPDILSKFKVRLSADKKSLPVLLSNGNLADSGDEKNGHHFAQWIDPIPKPNYLFAIVAGDLVVKNDEFQTQSGKKVALKIWTEEKDKTRVDHAMECLKKAMKWDEVRFGREYDLDIFQIVAVDAFNSGAMENKSLNIFNSSCILCDPATATDANYQYIDRVIAHEYFHNWTGDRITCRDWFQLTLKEGLTVLRDAEYTSDTTDRAVKRIEDASDLQTHQFPEDAGPLAHPIRPESFVQIENFYTLTVYEKGAEVIRMLLTFLGKDGFRAGMDWYFEKFDGQAVRCEDFISAFEATSGRDFSDFRESWYRQAGTPEINFSESFDPKSQKYTLQIQQKNPHPSAKKPYHFPVEIGLLDAETGRELQGEVLEMRDFDQTFEIDLKTKTTQKPVLSFLRNFSAPVRVATKNLPETDLFLLRNDTDLFNKFQAAQSIARQNILELVKNPDKKFDPASLQIWGDILGDQSASCSFRSKCLEMPDLYSIVREMPNFDYPAAFVARRKFVQQLARANAEMFLEIYESTAKLLGQKYEKTQIAIGRRALKNTALHFLSHAGSKFENLVEQQFESAQNMTDEMAALMILARDRKAAGERALEKFYQKWRQNALVMNKWFAVQAGASAPNTLEIVKKLESDSAFDMKNPNKLRSLFGVFARNALHFHASNGSGYEFLAGKVLEIDESNSMIAARLAKNFSDFAHLPPTQKTKMAAALRTILDAPNVSDKTAEVAHQIWDSGQ